VKLTEDFAGHHHDEASITAAEVMLDLDAG